VKRTSRLLVTDLKGPFSVAGRGGEQYFQLFTDADDKYRVVKFLTKKSDSMRTLREFLLVDVQEEGMMVENLQADGAPELISAASVELVAKQGGKLSYSPPYNPEMKGIAERGNQTVYNAGYAMLISANLPESFWVQAISYAVNIYNFLPTNSKSGWKQPFKGRFGTTGSVARFRIWGCIAYVHIPSNLRDSTLTTKAYGGYFVGFNWPKLDRYLIYVPSLDKIQESAHVHFDEVTTLARKVAMILLVDPDKRGVADFQWLLHLVYEDDENHVRYASTRVTTSRGYMVAYRAPVINGALGKEEQRPIHAKDGHTSSPSRVAAAAIESASATTFSRAADSGSGVDAASPRGLTRPAEDDGPVQGERLSKRQRRHRKPPNIFTLGGDMDQPPTERACYLAAAALGTEADDTNPMWDKSKVAEMHLQVLENDTYEVVSMAVLAGRMCLASMWACTTKSDGRDKSRFLPKGCEQRVGTDYNETWAPVAKLVTLRIFLFLVAILQLFTF
jgi:hypothetical protein